jgi:hypothetical protein
MSDSDSDSEIQDETPLEEIDPQCIEYISTIKRNLHDSIINGRPITDPTAQNNEWVIMYREKLRKIFELIEKVKTTKIIPTITGFPPKCQEPIQQFLDWVKTRYSNNNNNISYDSLFETHFRIHPFAFIISSKNIE